MSTERADDMVTRLRRLDTCTVSDAVDAVGGGAIFGGVHSLWEGAKVAGRAVTMTLRAVGSDSPSSRHLGVDAIAAASPGEVAVIDAAGRTDCGSWGGLLSLAAATKGLAGVVSDGGIRDVDEARELAFPVFGRQATTRTARGRIRQVACNERIVIDDVTVEPGDAVIADGSGVVVVAWDALPGVLLKAEEIARRESTMAERLRSGQRPEEVLDASYENMLQLAAARKGGC